MCLKIDRATKIFSDPFYCQFNEIDKELWPNIGTELVRQRIDKGH